MRLWKIMESWGMNHDMHHMLPRPLGVHMTVTGVSPTSTPLTRAHTPPPTSGPHPWPHLWLCPTSWPPLCVPLPPGPYLWTFPTSCHLSWPSRHAHSSLMPHPQVPDPLSHGPAPFHVAQPPFTHLSSHLHILGPTGVSHPPPTRPRPHLDVPGPICTPRLPPCVLLPCSSFPAPFAHPGSHLCALVPTDMPDMVT